MRVEMSVEEARRKLGDIVTAAARDRQVTVISKSGIPAAAVISLDMLREVFDSARELKDVADTALELAELPDAAGTGGPHP